jgi:protein-disulfide isomerase
MRLAFAALAATAALGIAASPVAAAFDEEERAAIREEIRGYLLENPEILREMIGLLEAQEAGAQAEADRALIAAHEEAIFDDGFSFVGGNPEGDVTVVEFIDYQCGFCRRAHPEVQALVAGDENLRLVTKELPILGPGSELASRAAIATLIAEGEGAYARLNEALLTLDGPVTDASLDAALAEAGLDAEAIRSGMDDEEVTRRLAETRGLAQALGISGTPTFVIGERLVRGYVPLPEMEALVDAARADG